VSACPAYEVRLVELARGAGDAEADRHAASCLGCAARLADERALTGALAALAGADAHREAPPEMEGVLRARLRKAAAPERVERRHPRPAMVWLSAAAVLLVGATLAFLRSTPEAGPGEARPTASRAAAPDEAEFTPLVYGEPLEGAEALHLARVRVPRSALPSLGWGEMDDGPPLEAEVLVGQDGLARGIRFVSGE
jgi:hypothetical protein